MADANNIQASSFTSAINKDGSKINSLTDVVKEHIDASVEMNKIFILRGAEIITAEQFRNLIKMLRSPTVSDHEMARQIIEESLKKL